MRVGLVGLAAIVWSATAWLGCSSDSPREQDEPTSSELPWDRDVELPSLEAGHPVGSGMLISASTTRISVDGVPVQALETGPSNEIRVPPGMLRGALITELYDVLDRRSRPQKALSEEAGVAFEYRVLLQADQALPWVLLRQVLYTAGQAQYDVLQVVGEHHRTRERLSLPLPLPLIGPGMMQTPTSLEEALGP
ncbi:MAG: hypothetical protein QGG40_21905, partial [Myxococcota bacterium]|nr:hypothetical protein [Myxococcota bacterium]